MASKSDLLPTLRVVQLPGGRWLCDVRGVLPDGSTFRRRVKPKVTTKKQADDYAAMMWKAAVDGTIKQRSRRYAMKQVWNEYKEKHVEGQRLKPSQKQALASIWDNHLGPVFGDKTIDAIGYDEIQAFKVSRAERAPKTVNNALIALKAMLRFAKKIGWLRDVPPVEMLKVPKRVPQYYDVATYNKLVAAALKLGDRHAAVVLLGGDAGLRAGEMIALTKDDLADLPMLAIKRAVWRRQEGAVKGHAERVLPLTERTVAVLRRLGTKPGPVLRSSTGKPVVYNDLQRLLIQAQEAAGVHHLSLHKLRHTYGTDVTRALGIRAAQVLLGHSEVTTTERYAHINAGPEIVSALEEARKPA